MCLRHTKLLDIDQDAANLLLPKTSHLPMYSSVSGAQSSAGIRRESVVRSHSITSNNHAHYSINSSKKEDPTSSPCADRGGRRNGNLSFDEFNAS